MPPKKRVSSKSASKADTIRCSVRVVPIKGAKQSALRVQIPAYTTPHAVRKLLGGCFVPDDGANVVDTAFVCAITQSIGQCCAVAKNSRNI